MPDFLLNHAWAVHISDGVLAWPWEVGGFAGAAALALVGSWRVRDEEIPRIALLGAAFFVASLIHLKVGPTSVHLLLNGLVGVVLGWRAALAIPVGLFLQKVLIEHGGGNTLGINSCIMLLPALLAWGLFRGVHRVAWVRHRTFRTGLVTACALLWVVTLIYCAALMWTNGLGQQTALQTGFANRLTWNPLTLAAALAFALAVGWAERRLEHAPEFPLGLLIGEVSVLGTALLNCLVLMWGGREDWHSLALLVFVAHLPVAVLEGLVLGFTVSFLARVKPEMLGWRTEESSACAANLPS